MELGRNSVKHDGKENKLEGTRQYWGADCHCPSGRNQSKAGQGWRGTKSCHRDWVVQVVRLLFHTCTKKPAGNEKSPCWQHWAGDVIKLLPSLKLNGPWVQASTELVRAQLHIAMEDIARKLELMSLQARAAAEIPIRQDPASSCSSSGSFSITQLGAMSLSHHTICRGPSPFHLNMRACTYPVSNELGKAHIRGGWDPSSSHRFPCCIPPSLARGLWSPDDGLNTKLIHGESVCRAGGELQLRRQTEAGGLGSHTWASIKCLISSIPPFQNPFWKKVARSAWQVKQSGQRGQFSFKCQIKLEAEDKFQPTETTRALCRVTTHITWSQTRSHPTNIGTFRLETSLQGGEMTRLKFCTHLPQICFRHSGVLLGFMPSEEYQTQCVW